MLTIIEKILFAGATIASLYFTGQGVQRIIQNISRGGGSVEWSLAWKRMGEVIAKVGLFQPVFRIRIWSNQLIFVASEHIPRASHGT